MRILTDTEFQSEAEPALRKIFVSDDPFEKPFSPNVAVRMLLHDVFHVVESPLLEALIDAAYIEGDKGFFLSMLSSKTHGLEVRNWYIPFSEISEYGENSKQFGYAFITANVIYSPQGKWGVMASYDGIALLGGTQKFVEQIRLRIPDLDEQVFKFIADQKWMSENGDDEQNWILELLTQVYGQEMGEEIFRKSKLPEYN
jgi:hypothetical protein